MTDKSKAYSDYLPYIIIALVGFAIYFNTLFNGYINDDYHLIFDNIRLRSIKYIPVIFSTSEWSFYRAEALDNYYRPFCSIIYMIEWHIFGDKLWGWHLFNITFHIINTILVFLIFKILLRDIGGFTSGSNSAETGISRAIYPETLALMGALIFIAHPVKTEAVAWAAAISELTFSLFYLLAFYLYLRAQRDESRKVYTLSVLSFLLASFSKETAITYPILIVVYDLIICKKNLFKRIPAYIPIALVAILYLALRVSALDGMTPKGSMYSYLSSFQAILNLFPVLIEHTTRLLLPVKLNLYHLLNPVYSLMEIRTILTLVLSLAISISLILLRKRSALYPLCLILFIIPLLPALYIPILDRAPIAERYLYLPSIGFALLGTLIIREITVKANLKKISIKKPIILAFITLIAAYSIISIQRNFEWKDEMTLLKANTRNDPDNYYLLSELGKTLNREGLIEEAIPLLRRSIERNLDRRNPELLILGSARLALAYSYRQKKMNEEAMDQYKEVLKTTPRHFDANLNIALIYHEEGDFEAAIVQYKRALNLSVDRDEIAGILLNMGNIYAKTDRLKEARDIYLKALKISPAALSSQIIINNISIIESQMGME